MQSKTNQYRNSFFVDTIVSWNKLPEDTARAKTVECFKEALPNMFGQLWVKTPIETGVEKNIF
jgi:hypothetical protein